MSVSLDTVILQQASVSDGPVDWYFVYQIILSSYMMTKTVHISPVTNLMYNLSLSLSVSLLFDHGEEKDKTRH